MIKKRNGFTLIELVIVIVVIGILIAIAVPRFMDLSDQAKWGTNASNVQALRAAVNLSYAENKEFPDTIKPSMFTDGVLPLNKVNGKDTVELVSTPLGYGIESADYGYWYVSPDTAVDPLNVGMVGAYNHHSPGSVAAVSGWDDPDPVSL